MLRRCVEQNIGPIYSIEEYHVTSDGHVTS